MTRITKATTDSATDEYVKGIFTVLTIIRVHNLF